MQQAGSNDGTPSRPDSAADDDGQAEASGDLVKEVIISSWEEALDFAKMLHRRSEFENAEKVYRHILALQPDFPEARHFFGVLRFHQGHKQEAEDIIRGTMDALADQAFAWNNLGQVLIAREDTEGAVAAYEAAIARDPHSREALSNAGAILNRLGRSDQARVHLQRVVELAPEFAPGLLNLATHHHAKGEDALAFNLIARATIAAKESAHKIQLASAYLEVGQPDEAAKVYREMIDEDPDNAVLKHNLAAITGVGTPSRASNATVVRMFDRFAETFDSHLAFLDYRAPELVGEAVAETLGTRSLDTILDAGCGTGLCAVYLRPRTAHLEGVDLSAAMLERAKSRNAYDALHERELVAFIRERPAAYDMIVSADTFCYFGDLTEVAEVTHRALRPGGIFVFTVEALPAAEGVPHKLTRTGRYAHSAGHVGDVLGRAGFAEPKFRAVVLRKEGGRPVHGHLVVAHLEA